MSQLSCYPLNSARTAASFQPVRLARARKDEIPALRFALAGMTDIDICIRRDSLSEPDSRTSKVIKSSQTEEGLMESANYLEYLFAAYTVFWLVISGYIYTIARKQKALEQELEAVKSEMQQ